MIALIPAWLRRAARELPDVNARVYLSVKLRDDVAVEDVVMADHARSAAQGCCIAGGVSGLGVAGVVASCDVNSSHGGSELAPSWHSPSRSIV